jgi:hypothetical protein
VVVHASACFPATHWEGWPCPDVCLDDLGSGGVADQVAAAIRPARQQSEAEIQRSVCCKHMSAASMIMHDDGKVITEVLLLLQLLLKCPASTVNTFWNPQQPLGATCNSSNLQLFHLNHVYKQLQLLT